MTIQTNGDDCRESGDGETSREVRFVSIIDALSVMSTREVIEMFDAMEEKANRNNPWLAKPFRDFEPWQTKRRTPWRKRR
ncbi:hypothetical protein [Pantoea sp. ME81]|uniref:hypothetical protein n=1 Tax=Pantoea sp. ME81 TaxID=2743935 RepID=UPI0015F59300|nr:hypothetical protein [Pantoea sp. ME81]